MVLSKSYWSSSHFVNNVLLLLPYGVDLFFCGYSSFIFYSYLFLGLVGLGLLFSRLFTLDIYQRKFTLFNTIFYS